MTVIGTSGALGVSLCAAGLNLRAPTPEDQEWQSYRQ
jgi:hypothetical protein